MLMQLTKSLGRVRCLGTRAAITRGEYKVLESEDIDYFRSILRPEGVITDQDTLMTHNSDWLNKYHGQSQLLLRPKTTGIILPSRPMKTATSRHVLLR